MELLASDLRLVLAPNAGPMTLEGTNTWVVGDPEVAPPVVVDPGPSDDGHLQAVLAACAGRVAEVVLTHSHADHSEGAAELARLAGCGVRAAEVSLQVGGLALTDGVRLEVAGAQLEAY
ncbi:MAG TPA: MBL fold metallo-hydrolase, partial [Propionibacteriaceae bacterium]